MRNLLFCLLFCLFLTGCATLIRGTKETLTVDSVPQAASVQLSTGQTGQTPFSVKVPRGANLIVTVSKPGYRTQQITVPAQVSPTGAFLAAANLFGSRDQSGLLGATVDTADGAAMEHKPNPLLVTLEKE